MSEENQKQFLEIFKRSVDNFINSDFIIPMKKVSINQTYKDLERTLKILYPDSSSEIISEAKEYLKEISKKTGVDYTGNNLNNDLSKDLKKINYFEILLKRKKEK